MNNPKIRTMTRILTGLLFISFLLASSPRANAGKWASKQNAGLALNASTNGLGGNIYWLINQRMGVRAGYEMLNYSHQFEFTEVEDIEFDADMTYKTGSINALFDFYLLKYVFASAGVGHSLFNPTVTGAAISGMNYGDITIPASRIGDFDIEISPSSSINPYIGIGFGRSMPSSAGVAFSVEFGSYYLGSPGLTMNTTGLLAPTSDPDHGHVARLERQIEQYKFYPVMKFSLSIRLSSF